MRLLHRKVHYINVCLPVLILAFCRFKNVIYCTMYIRVYSTVCYISKKYFGIETLLCQLKRLLVDIFLKVKNCKIPEVELLSKLNTGNLL